jgi:hydroxylamine reductase
MDMFCYQCQETSKNTGCTVRGVCGKEPETAALQDLLVHVLKGVALVSERANHKDRSIASYVIRCLFETVTNVNFDNTRLEDSIIEGLAIRDGLKDRFGIGGDLPDCALWSSEDRSEFPAKGYAVGVLATENEDIRSLKELMIYSTKGLASYAHHAEVLGYTEQALDDGIMEALATATKDLSVEEMIAAVMKTGEVAVTAMALLDKANTETYGTPEITEINLGVGENPGILISGHDLKDLHELLEQTEGTGVDVYTHGEMMPGHTYPELKKFKHLRGNYGGAWWQQVDEFGPFNGPILMTTNCLVPPKGSYKDRFFTTGAVGFEGLKHIPDAPEGKQKDFSAMIEMAKSCEAPKGIKEGNVVAGFGHAQVLALADKVVAAVKSGDIKRFVVMAGCDGRHKERQYFTDVAQKLPSDSVILTAGCAKYRYNELNLGDIGGIPRVLDAGQCNDCYSLVVIALKLKEVFELEDINDLPISFDIGWYEQKAAAVLLALLHLGVKGIRLGPTLPGFLSPGVTKVLVDTFDIKPIGTVEGDIEAMMAGN